MSEATTAFGSRARSFGPVADAYDRARPSYPGEAAAWLTSAARSTGSLVLELGAGTGKLTEVLVRVGNEVLATDPLIEMLHKLTERMPEQPVVACAEQIPMPSRSVDVVVCGQSFHWFDHDRALPEIARVLRPGGQLAVAWNNYDTDIPWVRRLAALIGPPDAGEDLEDPRVFPFVQTPYFGLVEQKDFRFWQPHTAASLADLASSVSHVSTMDDADRTEVLEKVAELYSEFGRGHDGMQVPYLTRCYRAVVRHEELEPEDTGPVLPRETQPPEDPGMQLIDFR